MNAAIPVRSSKFLTLDAAGEHIDTSPETIRYWISMGRLKGYRPGRRLLVRVDELEAFVAQHATVSVAK